MPELPEVETISQQLQEQIPFKIDEVKTSKVVNSISKVNFFESLRNLQIIKLYRFGKFLVFEMNNEHFLISHLGMTGSWQKNQEAIQEKHCHLILKDSSKKRPLVYVDPRRFGKMYYLNRNEYLQYKEKYLCDISSSTLTPYYLREIFKKYPQRQLKPFLLEQKFFAGSGNYIASEVCAHAGIRPTRRLKNITTSETTKIQEAFKTILEGAIKSQGVTFGGGYRDASGNAGEGVKNLVVFYQKTCGICRQTPVKKIILAQRGTYYCPKCQK